MEIRLVEEYNSDGYLIYLENFPGAFVRGRTRAEAAAKIGAELRSCARWAGRLPELSAPYRVRTVQTKPSSLTICDADTDVLFDSEKAPLTGEAYTALKRLAMRSAVCFQRLYDSIEAKDAAAVPPRRTFYGDVPRTAREMYAHTQNVNRYYFGEIGVDAPNGPDIAACRAAGFAALEKTPGFLENRVYDGSFSEQWTLRKVCRRFLWHDRIHGRAMYRAAVRLGEGGRVADPFGFASGADAGRV